MRKYTFLIYAVLWLLLIGTTFYFQMQEIKSSATEIPSRQAELFFENIRQLQQWHRQFEGVYAPATEKVQPIANIQRSDRDLLTNGTRQLTMIAPFCQSPYFKNSTPAKNGVLYHLTNLNPWKSENKPDAWEKAALEAFGRGESRREELTEINGSAYYRYIQPLILDESCVKCHTGQNLQVNSQFGAVSASFPAANSHLPAEQQLQRIEIIHGSIALIGLLGLLTTYLDSRKMQLKLAKAKRHLQLAYLDVLTQLPNRRYYDFFVKKEWKRAKRQGYPLSMIMIDIDYFKIFNDNYGHVQGDRCLQQVAKTMRRYFRRAGDLIARYGGEEFCVVAACDTEQIEQLAEILRKAVEDMKLPHPGSKISPFVTISLGTATVIPNDAMEFEELLRQADQTLYLAKEHGRNRVETFKP